MTEINKATKTEKLEKHLFFLQLVCVVISVFCGIWQMNKATSVLIIISFIITALLAFITVINRNDKYIVVVWFFIILLSYVGASRGNPDTTFDYMKEWIVFISTINLFFWVYAAKVDGVMIKGIFICGVMTAVIFVFGYLTGRTHANSEMPNYVTFGLSNPNLTGIYLLNIFLCIFILSRFIERIFFRVISCALCGVLFYFMYLTESRSCIFAAIACIFLSFIPQKKYSKLLTFLIIIFPLIFVFIYFKLIDSDVVHIFKFLETEGKSLTSRVKIWEYVLKIINNNMILGNYYLGAGNKHNTHLMILAAFGVPTFSLVIIYLNRIVNYIGQFIKSKYQFIALYSFYAIIIMGTFEASLFSGVQEMYVFSGAFLMIAKYAREKELIDNQVKSDSIKVSNNQYEY